MNNPSSHIHIAIIGSRDFNDYEYLKREMDKIIAMVKISNIVIISGGAKGADRLGKQYAIDKGYKYKEYLPNWNDLSHQDARIKVNQYGQQYDANAGHRRNTLIIDDSHIIAAFHNDSPGTKDSLKKAYKKEKVVYEFKF